MKKLKIIFSILLLVLLAITTSSQIENGKEPEETSFLPTSNEYGEIRYGSDWDDIPIGNGQKSFISYGTGSNRNVYEDNNWKRIEKARSIKSVYEDFINVKGDGTNFIRIEDFNLTDAYVCVKSKDTEQIPFKIFGLNVSFDGTTEIIIERDYKSEVNINILSKDIEQCFWIHENLLNVNLEFGENSTVLSINITSDSDMRAYSSISWDTVHDAATGNNIYLAGLTLHASTYYGSPNTFIKRVFLYFNTSVIASGSTIDAANLNLYGVTWNDSSIMVQNGTQANPITTADYDSCQPLPSTNSGEFGHINMSLTAWNSIVFNALGKSNINIEGITKLCVREYEHDYLDVDNLGVQYHNWFYSEEFSSGYTPFLNVTYTPPPSLEGNVTDSDGVPVIGALVFVLLNNTNTTSYNTTTDGSGEWVISPVNAGVYTVCAYKPTNSTLRGDCVPFVVVS